MESHQIKELVASNRIELKYTDSTGSIIRLNQAKHELCPPSDMNEHGYEEPVRRTYYFEIYLLWYGIYLIFYVVHI